MTFIIQRNDINLVRNRFAFSGVLDFKFPFPKKRRRQFFPFPYILYDFY